MNTLTVPSREAGDYLHPDELVELIDESSGIKYELYIRSSASLLAGPADISVYIPIAAIKDIQSDTEHVIVTISQAANKKELSERKRRISNASLTQNRSIPDKYPHRKKLK